MTVSVPHIEKLIAAEHLPWKLVPGTIGNEEPMQLAVEAVNALPALIAAVKALDAIATVYPFDCRNEIRDAREALAPVSFEEQAVA